MARARRKARSVIRHQIALAVQLGPVYEDVGRALKFGDFLGLPAGRVDRWLKRSVRRQKR
jgi:hypothetical protein